MFFKRKSNVIFRTHPRFGYIIDGSTYVYRKAAGNTNYTGDKILSESGAIFFSALGTIPQPISDIVNKLSENYNGVDLSVINDDAAEFYMALERDGFVVSGETIHECEEKDYKFSYRALAQEAVKPDSPRPVTHQERSTFDFLDDYHNGNPRLTSVHIEITSRCNEMCVHCYIPHEKKISSIDPSLFYDILKQSRDMGALHITLSGGEPMLHKHFRSFLEICRENNFAVNVLTNLTLINRDFINEMKANRLLSVQTSLYAMDPDVHDEITRIKGSFKRTINGIIALFENDIPLQINCPVIKQNKHCYADVATWARKYNIHADSDLVVIAGYDHTTMNVACRLSIDEATAVIRDKSIEDKEYFNRMESDLKNRVNSSQNDNVCSVCSSSICITENGHVYPCAGWQGYIVGDVKNNPISEIWSNSKEVRYLRELRKKDFPKCIQCPDKNYCNMCMVRNSNENPKGDPLIINEYFCNIANINKQLMLEWKDRLASS